MKRSQVRALLGKGKARATLKHNEAWTERSRRQCGLYLDFVRKGVFAHGFVHRSYASALLDGLDVRDVTEAGG